MLPRTSKEKKKFILAVLFEFKNLIDKNLLDSTTREIEQLDETSDISVPAHLDMLTVYIVRLCEDSRSNFLSSESLLMSQERLRDMISLILIGAVSPHFYVVLVSHLSFEDKIRHFIAFDRYLGGPSGGVGCPLDISLYNNNKTMVANLDKIYSEVMSLTSDEIQYVHRKLDILNSLNRNLRMTTNNYEEDVYFYLLDMMKRYSTPIDPHSKSSGLFSRKLDIDSKSILIKKGSTLLLDLMSDVIIDTCLENSLGKSTVKQLNAILAFLSENLTKDESEKLYEHILEAIAPRIDKIKKDEGDFLAECVLISINQMCGQIVTSATSAEEKALKSAKEPKETKLASIKASTEKAEKVDESKSTEEALKPLKEPKETKTSSSETSVKKTKKVDVSKSAEQEKSTRSKSEASSEIEDEQASDSASMEESSSEKESDEQHPEYSAEDLIAAIDKLDTICRNYRLHLVRQFHKNNFTVQLKPKIDDKSNSVQELIKILLKKAYLANNKKSTTRLKGILNEFKAAFEEEHLCGFDNKITYPAAKEVIQKDRSSAAKQFFKAVANVFTFGLVKALKPKGKHVKHEIKKQLKKLDKNHPGLFSASQKAASDTSKSEASHKGKKSRK